VSVVANVAINIDGKSAAAVLDEIKRKVEAMNGAFDKVDGAKGKIDGLAGDLIGLGAKFVSVAAAAETLRKSIAASFERSQAETRLKALTSAYGETAEATKLASAASDKFGITQTDATKAIGDVYGRLRPLGFSLKEISGVYDGFNVLSKQAALSNQEATSVFTQLSQALGSGTLRGDEFNRMAESMPAILGAVASELKVNQGELRGMAADGKITADVVVKALSRVGAGAKDLDKFLDPSTKAMNLLAKNTEEAQVQLGNLLKPAAIAVLEGLSKALGFAAKNMKEIVQVAVFFGTFAAVIKGIAIATNAWASASKLLAAGQKAAGVAAAFLQGVMNPASLATTALALGVAAAASYALGKAMDGAATGAAEIDPAAQKAAKATAAAKEEADRFKKAFEMAKEQAKELAITMQTQVVSAAKAATAAFETQIKDRERVATIVGAQIDGEIRLNGLYKIGLERQYNMAKTAEERRDIAVKIAVNEIRTAQLVYQQTLSSLQIETEKVKMAERLAVLKGYEILAEGKLEILKAKTAEEAKQKEAQLNDALSAQNQVIRATAAEVVQQEMLNGVLANNAKTQYEIAVATAATGLEQRLTGNDIKMSASNAANLANQLMSGATSSGKMSEISGELATRFADVGESLDSATNSAVANAYQFGTYAQAGIESTDQWRERVLAGGAAQQQVAAAVQQTTETVVAANNIRALSSTQTDAQIVASSQASNAGVESIWTQFALWFDSGVAKPIQSAWTFAMNQMRQTADMFWGWIPGVVKWGLQAIDAILYNTLVLPWKMLWNYVLRGPVTKMVDWIQSAWNNFVNYISDKATVISTKVNEVWQSIVDFFRNNLIGPIQSAWNTLMEVLPNALRKVANFAKSIFDGIANGIKSAFRGALQFVANIINKLGGLVNRLIRGVNGVAARVGGKKLPEIPVFTIPKFAKGGVVNKATLALVGEAGPEYIIPAKKMGQAAMNYLNGARGDNVIPAFANGGYVGSLTNIDDERRNLANLAFNKKLQAYQQRGYLKDVPMRPIKELQETIQPFAEATEYLAQSAENLQKTAETTRNTTQAPVINISTGPIVEFNGERYVTVKDFNAGLQQVADNIYKGLRRPSTRTALGLS
jgi:tape measure domain-containing protein